jgi:hypothetical protein
MTATEILGYVLSGDYIGLLLAVLTELFRLLASAGF